jgi:hypothetical protein
LPEGSDVSFDTKGAVLVIELNLIASAQTRAIADRSIAIGDGGSFWRFQN